MSILIAGIGNIFLGDDAFGVEVAQRLMQREWPDGVVVKDFGIRGFDLACELMESYEASILLDAVPRGEAPGTLYTMEIDLSDLENAAAEEPAVDAHALHPLRVLQMVKALGASPKRVLLVGCEPETLGEDEQLEGRMGLSARVAASVEEACTVVRTLADKILEDTRNVQREVLEDSGDHDRRGADGYAAA